MKHIISLSVICMLLLSCGGKTDQGNAPDTTFLESIDTASVIEMASVMKRDISLRLKENDIQAVGALCQEALDHISYFRATGEDRIAGIYTRELRSFVRNDDDGLDEMATQNYIVKQFVTMVCGNTAGDGKAEKGQENTKRTTGKRKQGK